MEREKKLTELRSDRDAAAARGGHAEALILNDSALTPKSRSDDFCSEHGSDHMRTRPGNSFPFCELCEADQRNVSREADIFWQELLDKTDRTSPEEYPEMALITRDELADFVSRARA